MNKRNENISPSGMCCLLSFRLYFYTIWSVKYKIIDREPHSGAVSHALPQHDTIPDPSPDELKNDETRWQDAEHVVNPPAHRGNSNDHNWFTKKKEPRWIILSITKLLEIVGRLQKDWEKETKAKSTGKVEDKNEDGEQHSLSKSV